ncbi:hypothetical protein EDB83DRAFT_2321472 [Lactarius deliciosus]|nr:hypothetical protein EDB83DRAFT_2321472 [Lactarius deliciosus]
MYSIQRQPECPRADNQRIEVYSTRYMERTSPSCQRQQEPNAFEASFMKTVNRYEKEMKIVQVLRQGDLVLEVEGGRRLEWKNQKKKQEFSTAHRAILSQGLTKSHLREPWLEAPGGHQNGYICYRVRRSWRQRDKQGDKMTNSQGRTIGRIDPASPKGVNGIGDGEGPPLCTERFDERTGHDHFQADSRTPSGLNAQAYKGLPCRSRSHAQAGDRIWLKGDIHDGVCMRTPGLEGTSVEWERFFGSIHVIELAITFDTTWMYLSTRNELWFARCSLGRLPPSLSIWRHNGRSKFMRIVALQAAEALQATMIRERFAVRGDVKLAK